MEVRALLLRRLFAVIIDTSLSIASLFYLFSFQFFSELYTDISVLLNNTEVIVKSSVPISILVPAVVLYFIYMHLRFISTLLFGVSIGQYIIGIYAEGSSTWKRIGGSSRVVLEFFFAPFVIFDLPVLFKKRSLKEVLTFTGLVTKKSVTNIVAGALLTLIFIVIALISPLFANLAVFDNIDFNVIKSKQEKLSDKSNFNQYRGYYSNYFHFSFFSSLGEGRYVLVPSYEVMRVDGKIESMPNMAIYDSKYDSTINFASGGDINLLKVLKKGRSFNPLFYARYPLLAKLVASNKSTRKPYHPEFGGRTTLDSKVKKEILTLITNSFELKVSTIFDHIISNGPFINGNIAVRNEILSNIQYESTPVIQLKEYGDQTFLSFLEATDGGMNKSLLSLSSLNPILLKIKVSSDEKNKDAVLKDFEKFFLGSSSWFFDYDDIFQVPLNSDDFEAFSYVDFWDDAAILGDKRRDIENSFIDYLKKIGKKALLSKSENFKNAVNISFNRLFLISKKRWSDKLVSDDFASEIKTLTLSFRNKDKNFFGIK